MRGDETYAFSCTGRLALDVRGQEESDPLGLGRMLWLRVEQVEPGCEEDPQLLGMSAAFAPATQIKTLVRHHDARTADRRVSLPREGLLERGGRCFLLARDEYGWRAVPTIKTRRTGWRPRWTSTRPRTARTTCAPCFTRSGWPPI